MSEFDEYIDKLNILQKLLLFICIGLFIFGTIIFLHNLIEGRLYRHWGEITAIYGGSLTAYIGMRISKTPPKE